MRRVHRRQSRRYPIRSDPVRSRSTAGHRRICRSTSRRGAVRRSQEWAGDGGSGPRVSRTLFRYCQKVQLRLSGRTAGSASPPSIQRRCPKSPPPAHFRHDRPHRRLDVRGWRQPELEPSRPQRGRDVRGAAVGGRRPRAPNRSGCLSSSPAPGPRRRSVDRDASGGDRGRDGGARKTVARGPDGEPPPGSDGSA